MAVLDTPACAGTKRKSAEGTPRRLRLVPCESESLLDPCARLLAEAELKRQSVRVGDDEPILTEPLVRPPAPAVWISGRGAQAGLPAEVPKRPALMHSDREQ